MLTALEKELMKKVMELDGKAQDADRCYRWWQEEKEKVSELENKLAETNALLDVALEPSITCDLESKEE